MEKVRDEGLRIINELPLPVDCLVMPSMKINHSWGPMHYHEYIEILYVLKGKYEVMLNGEGLTMPEGSMFVINAKEPHTTKGVSEGEKILMCIKFLPQVLYSFQQTVTEIEYSIPYVFDCFGSRRLFFSEDLQATVVPAEFDFIRKEQQTKQFGYELAVRSGIQRIFSWIMRYWHDHAEKTDALIFDPNTAEMVQKMRRYVEQHYAEATLSGAADACGLSYSYFSRVFNNYMKTSFSDYVNLVRVNQSLKMLLAGEESITEIALSVGFSSTSYYIKTFKKLKKVSPNKFRSMYRE